ncbi:MAG TPA: peptidylprolyl isomerase [Burkholderiaceae bacterium]
MNLKSSAALIGALVLPLAVMAQNVAVVNGKPVPMSRVDALIKTATRGNPSQEIPPEVKAQAKDQVVMREIFAQEAEKQGIPATADYKAQLDMARQIVLINTLFQNFVKTHPVTDADAKAEYDKIKAEQSGLEYHARHILVDSEDEAKKLIAQIKAGSKFEDVAKKSSKDTGSAENGGDLDWAKPAAYVPEFSTALQGLKKGQMTDAPVKTQFGYHIIRLEDTRAAQFPSFDEVKDKIKQQLEQVKLQEYQEKLRKSAKTDYKFAAEQQQQAPAASAAAPAKK